MSQSEVDKHIQVTIKKHFHWPVATDDIIRQLGRCKNAFGGVDVQTRRSSPLSDAYLALRFFNDTPRHEESCKEMPFGVNQAERCDFQAKATGWRIHLSWNSLSEVQSRGFNPKPINELFTFFHPCVFNESNLELKARFSTFFLSWQN